MNEFDPALSNANAKFAAFLRAVLDRANRVQRREFQASLVLYADGLDPEARRILETWTGQLRPPLTH